MIDRQIDSFSPPSTSIIMPIKLKYLSQLVLISWIMPSKHGKTEFIKYRSSGVNFMCEI